MVYDRSRADLLCFQRWVITGLYRFVPWDEYRRATKSDESLVAYQRSIESRAVSAGQQQFLQPTAPSTDGGPHLYQNEGLDDD
jgi:hypothetical protein